MLGRYIALLVLMCAAVAVQGQAVAEITAANGQRYSIAGRDRTRRDNEIVLYTVEFYKKNPTFKNGVDVQISNGKVVAIQDRAGAVYIQNKPDPGPIAVTGDGSLLSANGDARKWVLANIRIGDVVKISDGGKKNSTAEVPPAAAIPCFAGAYYRKAVTSFDTWTGIAGIVRLGTPKTDDERIDPVKKQPLDNFSIYMGGNAGGNFEVDAGMTWAFSLDAEGKVSKQRNAWRPFWRTKTWSNAPNSAEYTWHPGDVVQIAVYLVGPKKLRMIVADATTSPKKMFQTDFDAEGFAPNVTRQFKRVNAIDQFANEGKPVQATKAQVTGSEWLQTILFRDGGPEAKQIPMTKARFTDMRCNDAAHIVVTTTDAEKGAEKIDIYGTPKTK